MEMMMMMMTKSFYYIYDGDFDDNGDGPNDIHSIIDKILSVKDNFCIHDNFHMKDKTQVGKSKGPALKSIRVSRR